MEYIKFLCSNLIVWIYHRVHVTVTLVYCKSASPDPVNLLDSSR